MGGPRGGSIPLPRISGFSEDFFYKSKLKPEDEHLMSGMLARNRFQKGNRAARSYANLVVLFRMLLFYTPLKHHPHFWGWVAQDWGISTAGSQKIVSNVANLYSDARYAALGVNAQRVSLLVRLVDEWLLIRPRPEIAYYEDVDEATLQSRRSAWLNIRDYHVDMLMDSKLPANLVGVDPPEKMVTSLWEPDPEVAALLKETKTTRKPKHVLHKVGTPKSPAPQAWLPGPEMERKRKVSPSEREIVEIDESEPASAGSGSIFDERCFIPVLENTQGTLRRPLPADAPSKRNCSAGNHTPEKYYAGASPDSPDLIDLTPPQPVQQQQQQSLPKPSPVLIQSKLTHFANPYAAAAPDRRPELSAQLQRESNEIQRWQVQLAARLETETIGCVPPTAHHGPNGAADGGDGGQGLRAAEEWAQYDAKLREMEARVAALEREHRDDAAWGRSMGWFLYDANGRSLSALQDVFGAIDTLQKTSAALLKNMKKCE
ncbi:hypothetical protein CCM_06839 [Cordyceps militaris CM01]|uniref:Uncharacterized protein n=1 Tax=Cordyceps militaris (strain CM01) TaxID=983644 RepID=G3JL45_CORMM|nr:uncharacterized protein CCM_06839 [Cordyceps militaris CM01]EGX90419.1 hypothetical protein CCM_06839 [Cordyceps militaris CM01]